MSKQDSRDENTTKIVRFKISTELNHQDYIGLKTVKGKKRILVADAIKKYPTSLYRTISDKTNLCRINWLAYNDLMINLQFKNPKLYDQIQLAKKKRQFRKRINR